MIIKGLAKTQRKVSKRKKITEKKLFCAVANVSVFQTNYQK